MQQCGLLLFLCYNPAMAAGTQFVPDPVVEAYKRHVDRTLIRKNLKLTVEERLLQLMKLQEFAEELRRSGSELRRRR